MWGLPRAPRCWFSSSVNSRSSVVARAEDWIFSVGIVGRLGRRRGWGLFHLVGRR